MSRNLIEPFLVVNVAGGAEPNAVITMVDTVTGRPAAVYADDVSAVLAANYILTDAAGNTLTSTGAQYRCDTVGPIRAQVGSGPMVLLTVTPTTPVFGVNGLVSDPTTGQITIGANDVGAASASALAGISALITSNSQADTGRDAQIQSIIAGGSARDAEIAALQASVYALQHNASAVAFTSPATVAATTGQPVSFTVTAVGSPIPTIAEIGTLPDGMTFTANANGTAILGGAPTSSGTTILTFTATNTGGSVTQTFAVVVTDSVITAPTAKGLMLASPSLMPPPGFVALGISGTSGNSNGPGKSEFETALKRPVDIQFRYWNTFDDASMQANVAEAKALIAAGCVFGAKVDYSKYAEDYGVNFSTTPSFAARVTSGMWDADWTYNGKLIWGMDRVDLCLAQLGARAHEIICHEVDLASEAGGAPWPLGQNTTFYRLGTPAETRAFFQYRYNRLATNVAATSGAIMPVRGICFSYGPTKSTAGAWGSPASITDTSSDGLFPGLGVIDHVWFDDGYNWAGVNGHGLNWTPPATLLAESVGWMSGFLTQGGYDTFAHAAAAGHAGNVFIPGGLGEFSTEERWTNLAYTGSTQNATAWFAGWAAALGAGGIGNGWITSATVFLKDYQVDSSGNPSYVDNGTLMAAPNNGVHPTTAQKWAGVQQMGTQAIFDLRASVSGGPPIFDVRFNGGVDGVNLALTDTALGGRYQLFGTNPAKYTAAAFEGSSAVVFATPATGSCAICDVDTQARSTRYEQRISKVTTMPGLYQYFFMAQLKLGNTTQAAVRFDHNGIVAICDGANRVLAASTVAIAVNTWFAWSWEVDGTAVSLDLYTNPATDTVPASSITGSLPTLVAFDRVNDGIHYSGSGAVYVLDDAYSSPAAFVSVPRFGAVAVPTGVTATATSSTVARIAFTLPAGATGFVVQRDGTDSTGAGPTISPTRPTTPSYYDFLNLLPSTTYHIGVQTVSAMGSSTFVTVAVTTPATTSGYVIPAGFSPARPSPYLSLAAGNAFFNTPLPDNAPIDVRSQDWVNRLYNQFIANKSTPNSTSQTPLTAFYDPPFNTQTSSATYSMPIYVMPVDYPRTKVWSDDQSKSGLQAVLDAGVPIPDPATVQGKRFWAVGTDSEAVILQKQASGAWEMWEFWQASYRFDTAGIWTLPDGTTATADYGRSLTPAGYPYRCHQAGHNADIQNWPGWYYGATNGWGVVAVGSFGLAFRPTDDDWLAGVIRHPIGLATGATGPYASSALNPAPRSDVATTTFKTNATGSITPGSGGTIDANRVPEGARFRLPPGFDANAWAAAHNSSASNIPASAKSVAMICTAIRDYGLFLYDTAGVLEFPVEDSRTAGTSWSPYATTQAAWGNFGQDLPWQQFLLVAPTIGKANAVLPAIGSTGTQTVAQAQTTYAPGANAVITARGAFLRDTVYAVNDSVTYGGSTWICATAGTAALPGSNLGCWVPQKVPAAPTLAAPNVATPGQVTLTWTDNSNGGSAITGHNVTIDGVQQ